MYTENIVRRIENLAIVKKNPKAYERVSVFASILFTTFVLPVFVYLGYNNTAAKAQKDKKQAKEADDKKDQKKDKKEHKKDQKDSEDKPVKKENKRIGFYRLYDVWVVPVIAFIQRVLAQAQERLSPYVQKGQQRVAPYVQKGQERIAPLVQQGQAKYEQVKPYVEQGQAKYNELRQQSYDEAREQARVAVKTKVQEFASNKRQAATEWYTERVEQPYVAPNKARIQSVRAQAVELYQAIHARIQAFLKQAKRYQAQATQLVAKVPRSFEELKQLFSPKSSALDSATLVREKPTIVVEDITPTI